MSVVLDAIGSVGFGALVGMCALHSVHVAFALQIEKELPEGVKDDQSD